MEKRHTKMNQTVPIINILLATLILCSCGVSKKSHTAATPEPVNEEVINKSKVHYYNNPAAYFHNFGGKFVVYDSDGYVNMQNEPSINSATMTTIPNYEIVQEYYTAEEDRNWLVVDYYDYTAIELWYGYVHKSGIVEIPSNFVRNETRIIKDGYYVRGLDRLFIVRHITLESVELEDNYTLQVFFLNSMTLAFIFEEGNSNRYSTPISINRFKKFDRESDYREAGYDFDDENTAQIFRCFFSYRDGFFSFDELIRTNNGQIEPVSVIAKAASYDEKFQKEVNFVIKNDVVLFEGVVMISYSWINFK